MKDIRGSTVSFLLLLLFVPFSDGLWNNFKLANVPQQTLNALAMSDHLPWVHSNYLRNISIDSAGVANEQCATDLELLIQAMNNNEPWALKFADAWGKLPAGILEGNLNELGHYTECLEIKKKLNKDSTISGKYCLASLRMRRVVNIPELYGLTARLGTCLPASCSAEEFDAVLRQVLKSVLGLSFDDSIQLTSEKRCYIDKKEISAVGIVAITIHCVLALCIAIGTLYDYYYVSHKKGLGLAGTILMSFSLRSNMNKLLRMDLYGTKTSSHIVPSLNGIRCLSMLWVIFCHEYAAVSPLISINVADIDEWSRTHWSVVTRAGFFAVDSFFFIGGVLVGMAGLRELDRTKGKLNVLIMYCNRYFRLTPILGLAMLMAIGVLPLLDSGPYWSFMNTSAEKCKETWWAGILYIQNYVRTDSVCFGHAWYLAVDTHMFIISPLALIALYKWGKRGLAGIVTFGILLFTCLFSVIMMNDVSIQRMIGEFNNSDQWKIYYPTHTHALPWLVGFIFGYFLHTNKRREIILSKGMVLAGWTLTFGLLATLIYCLYPYYVNLSHKLSILKGALYYCFSRIGWPLVLSWIVFACQYGYGGVINAFLSWSYWQPLSRLTYSIYIWHVLVIVGNASRIKTNPYFSNYDIVLRFWSDFGITLCVAVVMYALVEAPFAELQTALIKNRVQASSQPNKSPEPFAPSVTA